MHRARKRRACRAGKARGAEQGAAIGFYHAGFFLLQLWLLFLTPDGIVHRTLPGCDP